MKGHQLKRWVLYTNIHWSLFSCMCYIGAHAFHNIVYAYHAAINWRNTSQGVNHRVLKREHYCYILILAEHHLELNRVLIGEYPVQDFRNQSALHIHCCKPNERSPAYAAVHTGCVWFELRHEHIAWELSWLEGVLVVVVVDCAGPVTHTGRSSGY